MPPKKTALRAQKASTTRRSTRRGAGQNGETTDMSIYNGMLAEAYDNNPDDFQPDPRPAKRRRIAIGISQTQPAAVPDVEALTSAQKSRAASPEPVVAQTAFSDDYSDSSSELEFEDVVVVGDIVEPEAATSLRITFDKPVPTPSKPNRRKASAKAELDFRHHLHKWHFLCLLVHLASRNSWCNDELVHATLKPLVGRKLISRLHREGTQAVRKVSFDQAIEEVCGVWTSSWTTTSRGMRAAQWRENLNLYRELEEAAEPVDLDDFRRAARERLGSRDVGAQLFCALLRSVAVDARLVCSLQVLPLSPATKGDSPPKTYIPAGRQDFGTGRAVKKTNILDSAYPIWWVEVFNPAIDQWYPLDPLVRKTMNKPRTGFEPPASDTLNTMSYVLAFEDDGTAKDVTRRYTSAYNAKTRKIRIDNMKHGDGWLSKVLAFFARPPELRDQIEDAALERRVAQEGMPKNVQDFKDHPVYLLERHLRANEVIHPLRECGKFTVGNKKLESVYRCADLHLCRSADGWYRRGRDVKKGEVPLKWAAKKRSDDGGEVETALYAEFQTETFIPPPALEGRVPRNGFGNLDVYVPGMIPPGAVHLKHPLSRQAAKVLGIDAVDAVTGFKFKGRQGTAIIDGVVVHEGYTAAMVATILAIEDQLEEEVNIQRSAVMAEVWRKMLAVLKVRQKIEDEYGGLQEIKDDADVGDEDLDYDDGGFVPEHFGQATKFSKAHEASNMNALKDRQPVVLPPLVVRERILIVRSPHKLLGQEATDELFGDHANDVGEQTASNSTDNIYGEVDGSGIRTQGSDYLPGYDGGRGFALDDQNAGGFLTDGDDGGGGFVVENETMRSTVQLPPGSPEASVIREQSSTSTDLANRGCVVETALVRSFDTQLTTNIPSRPVARRQSTSTMPRRETRASVQKDGSLQMPRTFSKSDGIRTAEDDDVRSQLSMLSHDPDEDEQEPQWIDEAFDVW